MALTLAGTPAFMAPEFYTEHYDEKVRVLETMIHPSAQSHPFSMLPSDKIERLG